jgi:hypothetical protein
MTEPEKGHERDWMMHLQGKIIVHELLAQSLLVGRMLEQPNPLDALIKFKKALYGSLEPVGRGDEISDAIWSESASAFEDLFSQAARRLKSILETRRTCNEQKCASGRIFAVVRGTHA